jgi:uncharacterized membrane protein YhaH (DUF805 family)
MFDVFTYPINRKQYWAASICTFLAYVAILIVGDFLNGGEIDPIVKVISMLAMIVADCRLLYLRAVDIGYAKPGLMVAGCFVPLLGLFCWLSIAFLPTGARLNGKARLITNTELGTRVA